MPKIFELTYKILKLDKVYVSSYSSNVLYDKHEIEYLKRQHEYGMKKNDILYRKYRWLNDNHPEYLL